MQSFNESCFLVYFTGECPESCVCSSWAAVVAFVNEQMGYDWPSEHAADTDGWTSTASISPDGDNRFTYCEGVGECNTLHIVRITNTISELALFDRKYEQVLTENRGLKELFNPPTAGDWISEVRTRSARLRHRDRHQPDSNKLPEEWLSLATRWVNGCFRCQATGNLNGAKDLAIEAASVLFTWYDSIARETVVTPGDASEYLCPEKSLLAEVYTALGGQDVEQFNGNSERLMGVVTFLLTDVIHEIGEHGTGAIIRERAKQVLKKGYGPEWDDVHTDGSLLIAALLIACEVAGHELKDVEPPSADGPWPDTLALHVKSKYDSDPCRRLAIAGALIAAEIDRLRRLQPSC